MSPKKEKPKDSELKDSRRKFLKNAGVVAGLAGAAAITGFSVGPASLPLTNNDVTTGTGNLAETAEAQTTWTYRPANRYYYLYATDGMINVPTDFVDLANLWSHRQVYIFGFAKPLSDNRPSGSWTPMSLDPTAPNFAFSDINLIDPASNLPIMTGKAQLPAPPIWGIEGDLLYITLFNLGFQYRPDLTDPHTVHLHGVHQPTAMDGIPELSFGVPMYVPGTPLNTPADVAKYSFTYIMKCERPGTYMYHCHVEASEHVQMGMYGPLWIYPKELGTVRRRGGWAYGSSATAFDQEAILLLSEIDTRWHDDLLNNLGLFNPVDYRPDWWLVNGRAFPDTVLPGKYTQGYQPGTAVADSTAPSFDSLLTYYPPVTVGDVTYAIPRQPVQTYVQTGID